MSIGQSITPDPTAKELAMNMADATSIQKEILEETLASAQRGVIRESGRTICPSLTERIKGPLARFPKSVDLQLCPGGSGLTGVMHTHVTPDEIRHPKHSIPDMANVFLEGADASLVAGTETADVLVATDPREAAAGSFRDALGVEVQTTADVVDAFQTGLIPDPTAARDRVRSRLGPLFSTESTTFRDLTAEFSAVFDESPELRAAAHFQHGYDLRSHDSIKQNKLAAHCNTLRGKFSTGQTVAKQAMGSDRIRQMTIATVVGNVIGMVTDSTVRWLVQG